MVIVMFISLLAMTVEQNIYILSILSNRTFCSPSKYSPPAPHPAQGGQRKFLGEGGGVQKETLNVTGSFADDIMCAVSSVGYRPLWLIIS